jgi:transposase
MARKRYKPEEIVAKLRQIDVLVSQGQNVVDAIRQIGVSEVTYYRWRQETSAAHQRLRAREPLRQSRRPSTPHSFWRATDSTRNTTRRHLRAGVVRDGWILVHQHSEPLVRALKTSEHGK